MDFDGRERRSCFPDNLAKRDSYSLGIAISAHFIDGSRIFPHGIGEWSVDARHSLLAQVVVLGVCGDTHDDHLGEVAGIRIAHVLADGIGVGEKAEREGLVHDGGANADSGVLCFNFPPHQDGNSERGEISRADMIHA